MAFSEDEMLSTHSRAYFTRKILPERENTNTVPTTKLHGKIRLDAEKSRPT